MLKNCFTEFPNLSCLNLISKRVSSNSVNRKLLGKNSDPISNMSKLLLASNNDFPLTQLLNAAQQTKNLKRKASMEMKNSRRCSMRRASQCKMLLWRKTLSNFY